MREWEFLPKFWADIKAKRDNLARSVVCSMVIRSRWSLQRWGALFSILRCSHAFWACGRHIFQVPVKQTLMMRKWNWWFSMVQLFIANLLSSNWGKLVLRYQLQNIDQYTPMQVPEATERLVTRSFDHGQYYVGQYFFTASDGFIYWVRYIYDDNGFHPELGELMTLVLNSFHRFRLHPKCIVCWFVSVRSLSISRGVFIRFTQSLIATDHINHDHLKQFVKLVLCQKMMICVK